MKQEQVRKYDKASVKKRRTANEIIEENTKVKTFRQDDGSTQRVLLHIDEVLADAGSSWA